MAIKYAVMSAFFMMWQCISEERGKMDFMGMKSCVHSYVDRLCVACNLGNNNLHSADCVKK